MPSALECGGRSKRVGERGEKNEGDRNESGRRNCDLPTSFFLSLSCRKKKCDSRYWGGDADGQVDKGTKEESGVKVTGQVN